MTPAACAALLRLQAATTPAEALNLVIDAVAHGLSADEAVAALETWERINARQVQVITP